MRKNVLLTVTASFLLVACSSAPPAEQPAAAPAPAVPAAPAPFKFVSVPELKELMAKKMEIHAETIWNAALDDTAPKNAADWKKLEDAANGMIEVSKNVMTGPLAKDEGKWKEESEKMIAMAELCLKAIKAKDLNALNDAGNKMTEESCMSCHKLYYTGPGGN